MHVCDQGLEKNMQQLKLSKADDMVILILTVVAKAL
jgi:hypothetical protein